MTLIADNLRCIRQDRVIFKGLGFTLGPGQGIWVKGKNGAGKSSLLRMIAGLLKPSKGTITWKDVDTQEEPESFRQDFRYIAHQDALKPVLSVRENIEFWAQYHGGDKVAGALKLFELEHLQDTPAQILSAGQKKRTNLARLVASPAPLWILDEPLSSLDTHYIDLFTDLLREHLEGGGLALLATHQTIDLQRVTIFDLDNLKGVV
ncbi:MAG: heme ABC exporter ATP-binding protein CcmA [Sneathiellales bacterium]|nr:heme ABC exporter ATP-binding protein CcmA [Sneathiellales bacterium]